ncbi:hypothetical protein [Pelagibius sp.]|uniref:hypothetical protein n=1 Tax=Pelagibius sp. TaxID=1931238 RepID=UPI0026182C91|nr:hypothetical protein [Pelagibius sp.]
MLRRLVLLILLVWAPSAQAAEEVTLRGGLHEDYGRLVFDWPREVGYEARISEGSLVVTFAEPADFSGAPLRGGLRGYAAAPQRAEDGRGLIFPLNGDAELKHFRIGSKVVLDLRAKPASSAGAVPAEAEQAAGSSNESLPKVTVRGGRHPDYSRLVFDWPEPVESRLEETPGRLRVVFDRKAAFDLAAVRPEGLPQIAAVTPEEDGVAVILPTKAKPKLSRSGTKVILDVFGAEDAGTASAPKPAGDPPAVVDLTPRPEPKDAAQSDPTPPADAAPQTEAAAKVPDAEAETARKPSDATPGEAPDEAAPTPLVPQSMGGTAEDAPAVADQVSEAASAPSSEAVKPAPESPPDTASAVEAALKAGADPAASPGAAPAAAVIPEAERGRLEASVEPVLTFDSSSAQGPTAERFDPVVLTFEWDRPAGAAAFRRGENLWLAFDRPPPRDLEKAVAAVAPHLGSVRLLDVPGATVVAINALPTVAPRLTREDNRWIVDLRPRSALPQRALAAPVVESGDYNRVRFPMSGADRLLWATDPDAGDRLVIVPTRGAGMGLTLPYNYPQFRSLQSQQGVILQPLSAGLEVAVTRTGVLVRDAGGLLVSDAEQRRQARRPGDASAAEPRLFDLVAWRRGSLENFQENRGILMNELLDLTGERLGVGRVALARFYFAHGFASETLGSLRLIEAEHPRLALDPELRLMHAASQLIMQDFRGAAASLAHPSLLGEREALLWQAVLAAQSEDWEAAASGFAVTESLIDSYPPRVRLKLRLAAAEAFLRAGDTGNATLQLGRLRRHGLSPSQEAQLQVVQGELQLAKGEAGEARALWTAARDSRHRPSQARARLALIDLGLEDGTLTVEEAIAELERLRFAWRGDQFEFTLLRRLAQLYEDENRHREALYALRQAVTSFPDSPGARDSAQRMRALFAEIYRGAGDPAVPPLRALALYQEFKELTPAGAEGDRLIASLADRLVEVDLLDRAAELLEGQVRYRLEGEEKARIGARLALVHLLDRNPEGSLAALDLSAVDEVDRGLGMQRRQLRARAFSDLNRPEDALELLEGDDSLDAETLRADIHWRLRQWPEAVDSLSQLVPLLPPRRPMTLEESQLVVNLAVALMLSEKAVELEDLNRRYGAAMAKGPHGDTFTLLVGDGEKSAITTIADELSKVVKAQDFMANYRERLKDGELSQFN